MSLVGEELPSPALAVNGTNGDESGLNPDRRKPAIRDPNRTSAPYDEQMNDVDRITAGVMRWAPWRALQKTDLWESRTGGARHAAAET